MSNKIKFRTELTALLNKHSKENGSDTPDWILSNYLYDCIEAFDNATKDRQRWYNRSTTDETPTEIQLANRADTGLDILPEKGVVGSCSCGGKGCELCNWTGIWQKPEPEKR